MQTFKILGLLLAYPRQELFDAGEECLAVVREEGLLPAKTLKSLEVFLKGQQSADLMELQEDYVETFDRGRAHCLHLFEHVHGESRDRGQAMVDLAETYAGKGLYVSGNELPDYLPLFLEYLSLCPIEEASGLLGDAVDIIAAIGAKLKKRQSPYAAVFEAIEVLSAVKPDKARVKEALAKVPKNPETLEELDEEWKEAEAFSGDPLADCNSCNAFPNSTNALQKMVGGAQ
ncbi:MAG: nitrate reductase molybdenum cofactor assembly chaperone [Alphaproteobacteria bacterium]|nr:nitrate reductase molybdenum cofactor assembly chaperone [Alphaproteobacteria bacterium]